MSLHCDQLLEMFLNKEINDLVDDCFEGSSNEHCIFTKVFFGGDTGGTSKRCVVTGVINFECDSSKNTDISLGYNSDSSALMSQSSSKNLHTEICNVSKDHEASLKRMKFSVDEPSNTEPNARTVLNHSPPSEEPVCRTTSFHLLELPFSGGGVKSSSYLLKHDVETGRGAAANLDALKCTLPSIVGKDVPITKTIASPVSQESFTNRLLATSPSAAIGEKSGFLLDTERPKEFDFPSFDESSVPMKQDSLKDARSFLHYHVVNLLTAAGWSVEKRKRPSRSYNESVYITPQQKLIRDFPKAWRLCGQHLFANGHALASMHENYCKEWSDFSKFSSDLVYTLTTIEKQTNQLDLSAALVLRWCLLDPFVTVVCINRKVGALKKGELVKVSGSLNLDAVSVPKNEDSVGNQFVGRRLALIGDSSLAAAETSSKRAVKLLKGVSICTANKESTCFFDTSGGMENLYGGISRNGTTHGLASASCLYDVPISSENHASVAVGVSNGNTNFPPKHVVEDTSMDSWEERDESLEGRKATDKVENCRTDGWFYSHGSDKAYIQLDSRVHSAFKLCRPSLSKYSVLTKLDPLDEPISPEFVTSEVVQRSGLSEDEEGQCTEPMVISKRKIKRKSKKISEIKLTTLYQKNNLGAMSPNKAEMLDSYAHEESKKGSGVKKIHCHRGGSTSGRKRCQIKDDDLLVSAIIKNKDFGSNATKSSFKPKASRSRALRKRKSQKGGCRLLPRNLKGGMNFKDGKWLSGEVRTVLSWLIDTGVVALNDGIVYRNPKDEAVVKEGLVSRDGIICKCCNMLLSVSEFKIHAGFKLNRRPCLNLFMESGKPFTMCLLQAWSAEYKTRKSGPQIVRDEDDDQNDDSCGLCGDGGELICCDNCPSTFHQDCLSAQELPEGSWYCLNCTCRICGDLVNDKEASSSTDALKCSQCEHKYHESCIKEKNMHGVVFDSWFCGGSCQEVYSGLHSRVGLSNCIADGFSWTLLRCIHDDQKVHSAQRFALKAECNSKLAVALTIMEECFLSMVDPRTGIDMIPQVLYNWGSEFARLNFQGFYSAVLEKDDVLISVASIRVHGVSVAEMPLIATCSKYRRQGMCRRLMAVIEEMLISCKVEKLVISAIPNLVDTWIKGFGFAPVEQAEKESFNNINLMVFPGTILLKKPLYSSQNAEKQQGDVTGLGDPKVEESADFPKIEDSAVGEAVEILDGDISARETVVETLNVCDDETELCLDEQKMK